MPLVEGAGRDVSAVATGADGGERQPRPAIPATARGQQPARWWLGATAVTSTSATAPPQRPAPGVGAAGSRYSHSMVPGGLLVTSSTTRLTSGTSLVIRVEMRARTS